MEILSLTPGWAVICKEAGELSEPAGREEESVLSALIGAAPGEAYPVHRLDRGTAGVMVIARTKKAAARLSEAARGGLLVKEYEAIVHGIPSPAAGEMRDFLRFFSGAGITRAVPAGTAGAKEAILRYEVKEVRGDLSRVKITLLTGRTHQIRAQFASRGFPLLGDRKYGAKDRGSHPALLSRVLSFPGEDGTLLRFEAPRGLSFPDPAPGS